jgi:hypothetical protein
VDFVVCMAGDPKLSNKETFMANFVQKLVASMRKHDVKRFLYQAGAFSPRYNEKISLGLACRRTVIGEIMGLTGNVSY